MVSYQRIVFLTVKKGVRKFFLFSQKTSSQQKFDNFLSCPLFTERLIIVS